MATAEAQSTVSQTVAKTYSREYETRMKRVVRTRELYDCLYGGHEVGETVFPKYSDVDSFGFTAASWREFTIAYDRGVDWLKWALDVRFVVAQNDINGATLDYEMMYLGLTADRDLLAAMYTRVSGYGESQFKNSLGSQDAGFLKALYEADDALTDGATQTIGPNSTMIQVIRSLDFEIKALRVSTTTAEAAIATPIAEADLYKDDTGKTFGYAEYLDAIEHLKVFIQWVDPADEEAETPEYEYFSLEQYQAEMAAFNEIKSHVLLLNMDSLLAYIDTFRETGDKYTPESWAVFSNVLHEVAAWADDNPTAGPAAIRNQFAKLIGASIVLVPKTPPAKFEIPWGAIIGGVVAGSVLWVKKRSSVDDKIIEYEKERARLKALAQAKLAMAQSGFNNAVVDVKTAKSTPHDVVRQDIAGKNLVSAGAAIGAANQAVAELNNFKKSHAKLEKLSAARAALASRKGV
jgi:hypothetical protein